MSSPEDIIDQIASHFPDGADAGSIKRMQTVLHKVVDKNPPKPPTFWHYTTGAGLLGIIRSGKLYASHVSGLNDSLEYMYFAKLMLELVEQRLESVADEFQTILYSSIARSLRQRNVVGAGAFITCFSTAADDLGQWRGYGGDGCAFAIEFDGPKMVDRVATRAEASWLRVIYDQDRQSQITRDVLDYHVSNLQALKTDEAIDEWARVFGPFHASLYDTLHAVIKHHKFEAEKEYRLFTKLLDGEEGKIEFGVTRSMITRRLELDWSIDDKLPIRSVMVGPAHSQEASRVAIGDLLRQKGYGDVPVTKSDIPYRMV